ncbi:hypothetical protein BH09PSE5_BH09PSE5_49870 [soil metagenome]
MRVRHWNDVIVGKVIHFVGRLTDEVFSFLSPALQVLAEAGVRQTLLVVDDARSRRLLAGLHHTIDIVLTREARSTARRWVASLNALRRTLESGPVVSIHLHGLVPAMLAPYVMRSLKVTVPVFYSPHGSRALGSFSAIGRVLWRASGMLQGATARRPIASMPTDARVLGRLIGEQVGVIDSPVDDAFFTAARFDGHYESPRPIVITAARVEDADHAALMSQLAVLLFDEVPAPGFNWIGPVSGDSLKRLKAAKTEVSDIPNEIDRAIKLSAASIYLAGGKTRGFPLALAEAMAVGLPCVALDTPWHRDLLRHDETGFLCSSLDEMLHHVARLLAQPELRERIGAAARQEAQARFTHDAFRESLLSAYDVHVLAGPMRPAAFEPAEAPPQALAHASAHASTHAAAHAVPHSSLQARDHSPARSASTREISR